MKAAKQAAKRLATGAAKAALSLLRALVVVFGGLYLAFIAAWRAAPSWEPLASTGGQLAFGLLWLALAVGLAQLLRRLPWRAGAVVTVLLAALLVAVSPGSMCAVPAPSAQRC